MKLKKMLSCLSIVLVLLVITAVPAFAAGACAHTYEKISEVPATCKAEGSRTEKCSICGAMKVVPLQKIGHTYEKISEVPATCKAEGSRTERCSECGETKVVPLRKTGHTYEKISEVPATCKAEGSRTERCSECGETKVVPLRKTGHTEVAVPGKAATCTENGLTAGKKCSVCDEVIVAQETIPATGHTPAAPVRENEVAATETASGSYDTVVYCSVCHAELIRETTTIPAVGPVACEHRNTKIQGEKKATCTEAGYTGDTVCADCGKSVRTGTAIPAAGHTEKILPAKEANCQQPGLTEGKECSVCGEVLVAQENLGLGKHVMKDEKCVVCGYQKPASSAEKLDNVPKTGDITGAIAYGAAALVSLLGISVLLVKRKLVR